MKMTSSKKVSSTDEIRTDGIFRRNCSIFWQCGMRRCWLFSVENLPKYMGQKIRSPAGPSDDKLADWLITCQKWPRNSPMFFIDISSPKSGSGTLLCYEKFCLKALAQWHEVHSAVSRSRLLCARGGFILIAFFLFLLLCLSSRPFAWYTEWNDIFCCDD